MGIVIMQSIATGMIIAIAIVASIFMIMCEVRTWKLLLNEEQVDNYATVISKRQKDRRFCRQEKNKRKYFVEYKMDDGNVLECTVDSEEYNQLKNGDLGILSYKGMKYIGFKKAC